MSGTLYLCATPIGNLEDSDISGGAHLQEVDLIAAEDTRNSVKLLNHFDIHTPMTSYHEYNKYDKGRKLVDKHARRQQHRIDHGCGELPGYPIRVKSWCACAMMPGSLRYGAVPGPAACITALTISGLPTRRFAFEGVPSVR